MISGKKGNEEGPAVEVTTIGIDLAKSVFGVHGVDGKTSFPAWTEFVYTNENACCLRKAKFSAIVLSEPRVR